MGRFRYTHEELIDRPGPQPPCSVSPCETVARDEVAQQDVHEE
jgi:hypothetical protein